jgi:hypothetical protein
MQCPDCKGTGKLEMVSVTKFLESEHLFKSALE